MRKTPFTLLIHIALAIIVAGAFVTHFFGIQGSLTLRDGEETGSYELTSGHSDGKFPFSVRLDTAEVIYYPGTTTPMDFRSVLTVDGKHTAVSMNNVAVVEGWRFYQSGMGPQTTTLSVSHDPWGVGITYTGYILLGFGMIGFFFQKKTVWRGLLRKGVAIASFLIIPSVALAGNSELPAMQRPLARNFGKVYVYWNDRICPMQTMALDVTVKLYGSRSYRGMTPEQVISGWLFYYDDWNRDYFENHSMPASKKAAKKEEERRALISWMGSGQAFRVFPYHSAAGNMEWLSLTERRPSRMSLEQWIFMNKAVTGINDLLLQGRNRMANEAISEMIEGQKKYAGVDVLPSDLRFRAELFYNNYVRLVPVAVLALCGGALGIFLALGAKAGRRRRLLLIIVRAVSVSVAMMLLLILSLRGWIGGHWPLSNGCETMLFMGFVAAVAAVFSRKSLFSGALSVVAAMAVFVAAMAAKTPQIESLMPVLDSPLLTIHVMIVMCSYVLFLLMAILAAIGLAKGGEMLGYLARINAVILVPAVFLLIAGIFIGAVWANQSWGRYWGWDPKETCALITMLIYALPMHRLCFRMNAGEGSGKQTKLFFADPKNLCIYLLVAIVSVLFTYFGANFLIPGLHSYA